ncbi:helix-turn-helix domain-containing protein [Bacteroides mediterraneensis]|uniref:helix-turn-helix domain-containing protein n=1 Tax=Bacteroides mediterraneensis TaxID=1841856 RepID=UPI000933737B|nr:helix-turn-helix domain-containing protein [Bacteroides mediterraneensis]
MRKQSQINRAIEHLKSYNDAASRIQVEVLEMKCSESWVFNQYVRDVPEDERDETLFYAARDAAQFLAGKIGISAICPDLEDEPEEEEEETITISLSEYKKLLLRLERVERRLGLRVGDVAPAPRKDISEAPDELIGQADACRMIGCAKTTIKQWANKGLITRYQKGYNVYYSRRELLGSSVVRDYKDSKSNKE